MSSITVVPTLNMPPTLIRVHEAVLIQDEIQSKSLLHSHQAMEDGFKFDLTPIGHRDSNSNMGYPKLSVKDKDMCFNFDGRKLFQTIRKPTESEL